LKWKLFSLLMLLTIAAMGVYWWRTREPESADPARDLPSAAERGSRTDPTPPAPLEFEVFFSNSREDPESERCATVYPVRRQVPPTSEVARAALGRLLEGPSPEETEAGYFTNLSSGVALRSVDIEEGVAVIDFSRELEGDASGSCQVQAIRAQVTRTLLQFPAIREVRILVEGRPTDALQP
jgi:spore germination protein GerM